MPYVHRNAAGTIESLHRSAAEAPEFLPEEHPEVRAFLSCARPDDDADPAPSPGSPRPAAVGNAEERFAALDADFVRVIEDVIDTLIAKNVINITDLPAEAQTKLFSRRSFRERANRGALELFGGGEGERSL